MLEAEGVHQHFTCRMRPIVNAIKIDRPATMALSDKLEAL